MTPVHGTVGTGLDPAVYAAVWVVDVEARPTRAEDLVGFGYGERRVRGTASLLAPSQPVSAEGEAFVRSIRFTSLR